MRGRFSSRFRWLTVAIFGSRRFYFRPEQAEFPVTHQSACDLRNGPFLGRYAAGRASIDALRRTNNSLYIKDPYEISFTREALAAFARRFPSKGRSPVASAGDAGQSPQENLLATPCGYFQQRQVGEKTSQYGYGYCYSYR